MRGSSRVLVNPDADHSKSLPVNYQPEEERKRGGERRRKFSFIETVSVPMMDSWVRKKEKRRKRDTCSIHK